MRHIKGIINQFLIDYSKANSYKEQNSIEYKFRQDVEDLGKFLSNQSNFNLIKKPKGFWRFKRCPNCNKRLQSSNKYCRLWVDFSVYYCNSCDYQTYHWHVAGD